MSSKATYHYPDGSVTFDETLIVTGTGTPSRIEQLERENAALRLEVKVTRQNYEEYKRENIALREALVNADELERYSGSNGERQWGKCSAWLNPDDAVIIISAKALDAARKEAQL